MARSMSPQQPSTAGMLLPLLADPMCCCHCPACAGCLDATPTKYDPDWVRQMLSVTTPNDPRICQVSQPGRLAAWPPSSRVDHGQSAASGFQQLWMLTEQNCWQR